MGGVTYIHTKTSLVTKYCNTTDQIIIIRENKETLEATPMTVGLSHLSSPHLTSLSLSPHLGPSLNL